MSREQRLGATLDESQWRGLEQATEDQFESRTEAERKAVKVGLQSLGYLDQPEQPHEQLLWVVSRAGLGLGFLGLVTVGVGIFGPRIASVVGFGLTLTGLLLLVTQEWLARKTDALRGEML